MSGIEVGQEVFYIHNHYWKEGDELPEVRVGIVVPNIPGVDSGYSVRPKKYPNSAILTKYLSETDVFTTEEAAYIALFDIIITKIGDHQTGITTLCKYWKKLVIQRSEYLGGSKDDGASDQAN